MCDLAMFLVLFVTGGWCSSCNDTRSVFTRHQSPSLFEFKVEHHKHALLYANVLHWEEEDILLFDQIEEEGDRETSLNLSLLNEEEIEILGNVVDKIFSDLYDEVEAENEEQATGETLVTKREELGIEGFILCEELAAKHVADEDLIAKEPII